MGGVSTGAVTNGPLGTGTLTLNNGARLQPGFGGTLNSLVANAYTMTGTISLNQFGSGAVGLSGTGSLLGNVILSSFVSSGFPAFQFNGNISGAGRSITVQGNGGSAAVEFSGQNTFSGGLTINTQALVRFGSSSTGAITNGPAGTGTMTLDNGTIEAINAAQTVNNAVTLAASSTSTVQGSQNLTLGGIISGTGALVKKGTSTLTFSGASANTFSGGLTINNGQVNFNKTAGVNAIGSGSTIQIDTGSILNLSAANQIPTGAAMILNGGTFQTGGLGVVIGNAALGTLTLSDNSTIDLGSGSTILKYANSSATIVNSVELEE